jgi:crotonobetainyl-CoA:carnitine CoA-transferase CaiB-like acyl-CoA transferase
LVLEFAWTLPGPYCGQLLADLGASVVKVEPPERGDSLRSVMPGMFAAFNRGKSSLSLDLKNPRSAAVIERLAKAADVVVEGFRPGVADRLGIGSTHLRRINPSLVYCSISGFGQSGPWRERSGHDVNYAAIAGVYGSAAESAPPPAMSPLPLGDLAAGALAALTILASIVGRQTSGRGEVIDLAIADVMLTWTAAKAGEYLATGTLPAASEQQPPTHELYRSRDGELLALGAIEDHFWERLCRVVGREDWLSREEFADNRGRARCYQEINEGLQARFLTDSCEAWAALLTAADVPANRVVGIPEAVREPGFRARGLVTETLDGNGWRLRHPALLGGLAVGRTSSAPDLGEGGVSVLRTLGCSEDDLTRWRSAGVFG